MTYTLVDVEERQQKYSETFWIPSKEDRENLQPGDHAKLIFDNGIQPERMWVLIDTATEKRYIGWLDNNPIVADLEHGDVVEFEAKHVVEIEKAGESKIVGADEPNIGYVEPDRNTAKTLH